MRSIVVRPHDPTLAPALRLASFFAVFTILFHIAANLWQAHIGWGYFRDEFYYLACGRHLAWGYVDHGPLVAVQARLAETLFGHSLAGIRMLSGVAGGLRILLTGLLAWSLGGRRAAQVLAMLAVLVAPEYLALDGFLSMNSVESACWMAALLAIILLANGGSPRLWLLFGAASGLGLLNKPSMTFFLLALLAALLLTPQRRLLYNRWAALGVALLLLIALPNLLWQAHNHWPTYEFLHNGRVEHKNKELAPPAFLLAQIISLGPLNLIVWLPGLVWLLRRAAWRWIGITYLLFLVGMMAMHAKDYYVVPIYPILFAAGGLAWEARFAARNPGRLFAFPVLEALLLAQGLILLPMSIPVLRPATWLAYADALHLRNRVGDAENGEVGPFPQFYADRFGWQEEVDQVTRAVQALSPQDRARAVIFCSNYGEAGALEFLGHNLPPVLSGQNNYFLWGSHGATGELVLNVNGASPAEMREIYQDVQVVGRMDHPYAMPYEHRNIYLARHRNKNLTQDWPDFKVYR